MERQAGAAAVPEQQNDGAAETALHLLLQHDSVRTQLPLVCRLLCCSKPVAAAAAQHSMGQLAIPRSVTTAAAAQPAAAWLRKHVRLARSLDVSVWDRAAARACAAALLAAGPQTLMLQSLGLDVSDSGNTNLPLLEQLPASFITRLHLRVGDDVWSAGSTSREDLPAHLARVSAALGRLTALHTLELDLFLFPSPKDQACRILDLSGVSSVTSLHFHEGRLDSLQHNAPPRLLELTIDNYDPCPEAPVHLQALTRVTRLELSRMWAGNQLPPNLLHLRVSGGCRSVEPALALQQLRELDVWLAHNDDDGTGDMWEGFEPWPDITADQLRQLTALTALRLAYSDGWRNVAPASAAAWPLLPLARLEVAGARLSGAVCRALGQLTGLTSLRLSGIQLLWDKRSEQKQLAVALRRLSALQVLQLSSSHDSGQGEPGAQQLAEAVCSLQQLRQLTIDGSQLAAAARSSSLAGLHDLTSLSLSSSLDNDAAVLAAIVPQLPRLQSLGCSGTGTITDEAMPAIGQLQQLTSLALSGFGVTDAGLQHLGSLPRLQQVAFDYIARRRVTDQGARSLKARGVEVVAPLL